MTCDSNFNNTAPRLHQNLTRHNVAESSKSTNKTDIVNIAFKLIVTVQPEI